jgi:hypothetical protein
MKKDSWQHVKTQLKLHLCRILDVATKEVVNDFYPSGEAPANFSRLDPNQILALFVDTDSPTYLRSKREATSKYKQLASALLKHNGTVIPAMKRYAREGKAVEDKEFEWRRG